MNHLTREELSRWLERGLESDRQRVVEHLASCEPCAAACAQLVQTAPAGESVHFRPEDFIDRGYRARKSRSHGRYGSWARLTIPVAAAVFFGAVLLGRSFLARVFPESSPAQTYRGPRLGALSPRGEVEIPFSFRWTDSKGGSRYLVEVFDDERRRIYWAAVEAGTELPWTAELMERLAPDASYAWMVTALDSRGSGLLSSPLVSFKVVSRAR